MTNTEKTDWTNFIHPALYICQASGRAIKPCEFCGNKLSREEKSVELVNGAFRNMLNYTSRFHYDCFLKILAMNFPELIFNKILTSKLKKEIVLSRL